MNLPLLSRLVFVTALLTACDQREKPTVILPAVIFHRRPQYQLTEQVCNGKWECLLGYDDKAKIVSCFEGYATKYLCFKYD
jgi:hypothetical protein